MQNRVLPKHANFKWNGRFCQKKNPWRIFWRCYKLIINGKYYKQLSPRFLTVGNTFNVEKHETDNKSPEWATTTDFAKYDRIISFQYHRNQVLKNERDNNMPNHKT